MTTFTTVEIDPDFDLVRRLSPDGYLWTRLDEGFVAWGEALQIPVTSGPHRFERAATALAQAFASIEVDDPLQVPGTGPIAFGSFTFDDSAEGSVLVVPEVVVARRQGRAWMTFAGSRPQIEEGFLHEPAGRIRHAGSTTSELAWLDAVAEAGRAIGQLELEKVVLARDLEVWSERPLAPASLAMRLAARFEDCFTFFIRGLIGASPEMLVRRFGPRVESVPLAGSMRRGEHAEEDELAAKELLGSDKDRLEHRLAVESVLRSLAPLSERITCDPEPHVLPLANIQHLATSVRARLRLPLSALEVAGALHPTAAVCGTPTDSAREFIGAHEGMPRDRYAGPVGWVDARGDGEWAIALRSAMLTGNRARLFAGAGIVAGSLPEAELEETRLKFNAMLSALESP